MTRYRTLLHWNVGIFVSFILVTALFCNPLHAADKALLIGVGDYAQTEHNLPGIDIDLKVMQRVARRMGYQPEHIKVLRDAEVSRESVAKAFQTWLVDDVSADDRVLVYYSGHGSQIPDQEGDERDGYDEVLSMHGFAIQNGETVGVMRDDEFNQLLAQVPSEHVAVIVDACCSGTAVRSHRLEQSAYGAGDFVVKSSGCRSRQLDSDSGFADKAAVDGLVFLAAAQDGEQSLATPRGSLFTLAIGQAVQEGKYTSAEQLMAATDTILATRVPKKYRFHPSLIGDPKLLHEKGLFVTATGQQAQPQRLAWDDWFSLVKSGKPLAVQPSRGYYTEGQVLELDVEVEVSGYLNIVAINPNDQVVVLYPNVLHQDNHFESGLIRLPKRGIDWPAGKPFGESLIVSLLTQEPINLYKTSHQRTKEGEPLGTFLTPEIADLDKLRSIIEADQNEVYSSGLVLTVCESSDC